MDLNHSLVGRAAAMTVLLLAAGAAADTPAPRWFGDRPIAREEHDDNDVPVVPEANHLQELATTLTFRDGVANEIDRILALEGARPALDVNAQDEVPCSTWFCARNHLTPMSLESLTAGPAGAALRLPLVVTKGKDEGAASGFQVGDADGHKFLLKLDPAGHLGLVTAAEMVGNRIFHAAGYNVPGAFLVDLQPDQIKVDPHATFKLFGVSKRPLTEALVRQKLAGAARLPDGTLRAVAIPWIQGEVLASFDMQGVRKGDGNDRIPHQDRRSLRASWVLFAWLSVLDPASINTIDSYVYEGGRHFVRHYFIDFSCAFGSATNHVQGLHQDGEYLIEVGRTLGAFATLGFYRRPFQDQRDVWRRMITEHPGVGYFPAEGFDPDSYRSNRKNPAFMRMTARDAYWGAKVVTSFSDEQIAAVVATAKLGEWDASYVRHGLQVRRDILGRRYLRAVAAIESPQMAADGTAVCFDDLAVTRGYAMAGEVAYAVQISDGFGKRLAELERRSEGPHACLPIGGAGPGTGYRVIEVRTRFAGAGDAQISRAARIHLRWRAEAQRFVVVGLERED